MTKRNYLIRVYMKMLGILLELNGVERHGSKKARAEASCKKAERIEKPCARHLGDRNPGIQCIVMHSLLYLMYAFR